MNPKDCDAVKEKEKEDRERERERERIREWTLKTVMQ